MDEPENVNRLIGYGRMAAAVAHLRALGATVGRDVFLDDVEVEEAYAPLLTLEDGAVVGQQTRIVFHDSAYTNAIGRPVLIAPVTVGARAYVGARCILLPGVTIGAEAVVAAGSIVTRDVPPGCVAAGVPARVIGKVSELADQREAQAAGRGRELVPALAWRDWDLAAQERLAADIDATIVRLGRQPRPWPPRPADVPVAAATLAERLWRFAIAGLPLPRLRLAALRALGVAVSPGAALGRSVTVLGAGGITLGEGCVIQPEAWLDGRGGLDVGRHAVVGARAMILSADASRGAGNPATAFRRVRVGDHCWIGAASVIMPGVMLGTASGVLPGAVVSGDVAAGLVVGGNPAVPVEVRREGP